MQDSDPPKTDEVELLRRLNEIAFRRLQEFKNKFEKLQEYERSFEERVSRIKHRREKNRNS